MRLLIKIASLVLSLFLASLNNAGAHEEVRRHVLKNGLVVLVEETHKAPVAAIHARIKTGSATEEGYLGSGITHFVEHMLFKGTKRRPGFGEIEGRIKSLGGYINGFTSHDSTGVILTLPAEHINEALEVLKDLLSESLFNPQELEKEREVILKEVRLNNDAPERYSSLLLWSTMFKTHNYRFPVIGYEELLKKLSREDLVNYYKRNFVPDNIVIAIAGDVNGDDVLKTVEEFFGRLERASLPSLCSSMEPPQITGMEIEEVRDVAMTYLSVGFHSVGVRDRDLFSLDVLAMLLGMGEDSRLFKELYKRRSLVYSISSFNYTPKDPGVFAITALLEAQNVDEALKELWNQIEAVKISAVSDNELKKARNNVLSDYLFSRQTVDAISAGLAEAEVMTGDYNFLKKYIEGINTVTKESVREAAKKYLKKENATIIKVSPKKAASGKQDLRVRVRTPLLSNVERLELNNNLRVFILEDHTLPLVSLSMAGMGGLRGEDFNNNGISNLTADTILCGTKKRSEDEISSQIESAGADIDSYSGSNTFGLSISGLKQDTDLMFDIFADLLRNPVFPADKVEREKAVSIADIKTVNDDIYRLGIRTLKRLLFKNHPYRFQTNGRAAAVRRLSQMDVRDYFRAYYTARNMVVAIAGDVDRKAAKKKAMDIFGKFEKGPAPRIDPPKEKRLPRPRIVTRNAPKEQSLLLLGCLGATVYDYDKYVLAVLSSVLSGTNGRLSKAIREERGLAYTLDAASIPGIETGMFLFYIGTTRDNLRTARDELFRQIGLLKKEGITKEELRSAKRELIGLHEMALQRPQDIVMKMAVDELCGLDYDSFLKYKERINRVSLECVTRAARKYLNDYSYVLVIVKGEG